MPMSKRRIIGARRRQRLRCADPALHRRLYGRAPVDHLPCLDLSTQIGHSRAHSRSLLSNPVITRGIATHFRHYESPVWCSRGSSAEALDLWPVALRRLVISVAFAAKPVIFARVRPGIPAVFAVAFEALAMHPAAARRVVLATRRLLLTDFAVICDGCRHAASPIGTSHFN